jgi:integrase
MANRDWGDGSIAKRKDGRLEVRLSVGKVDGARRRISLGYAATRSEARELLRLGKLEHLDRHGRRIAKAGTSTGAYLETKWLPWVKENRRPATFSLYEHIVRLQIIPVIGSVRLIDLRVEHVDAVDTAAKQAGMSANSRQLVRVVLGAALRRAEKWQIAGVTNPVPLSDGPTQTRPAFRYLDPLQARVLLATAAGDPLEPFVSLALYCGLRLGELQGLTWGDIDLDKRQVRVVHQRRVVELSDVKTDSSKRTIDLPGAVVTALRAHQRRHPAVAGALVFPWSRATINRDFARLLERAGLANKVSMHGLRHSCASLLFAAGVAPKTVSEILGHSKVSITLDRYTHLIPTVRRAAADALDSMLG